MKGIGDEPIFAVGSLRGRMRNERNMSVLKNFDGQLNQDFGGGLNNQKPLNKHGGIDKVGEKDQKALQTTNQAQQEKQFGLINESDSQRSNSLS